MIVKGMLLLFFLIVAPFLTGGLFSMLLPEDKRSPETLFVSGLLAQYAVFEIIAIACMLILPPYIPFVTVRRIFTAVLCLASLGGAYVLVKQKTWSAWTSGLKTYGTEGKIFWLFFLGIVLVQLYFAATHASFDGDDAYYVVQSVQTYETNSMYTIVPYTGDPTKPDMRHALAVITMWEAFIAQTAGIHATIIAHTVLPLFFIPLSYLAWYQAAKLWCKDHIERLPVFMTLYALFVMFGNTSIYTAETFLLTRTWQGKSLMANVAVPLILWLFAWILTDEATYMPDEARADRRRTYAPWILLGLTGMFAGICTSIGAMLAAALIAVYTVALFLYARRVRHLACAACALVPDVLYMLLYVLLK